MEKLTISQAQKLSSPNPFALVCVPNGEKTNVAAFSWWTYVSNKPPMLLFCASKKGFTGECIKKESRFVLCLPDESLANAAYKCGTVSGRSVDKPTEFGIELVELGGLMVVAQSKVVFVCKLESVAEGSDHFIYIAEIVDIYGSPEIKHLMATEGYAALCPAK